MVRKISNLSSPANLEMKMKGLVQAMLILPMILSDVCIADVPTPIEGETTDGWKVFVDAEASAYPPISIWEKNDFDRKTYQKFRNEHCVMGMEAGKPTLFCPNTAKSPLAGTKYIGYRNTKGSCEKGDPEYIYKCVSGCKKNKRAPRQLFQRHYEC